MVLLSCPPGPQRGWGEPMPSPPSFLLSRMILPFPCPIEIRWLLAKQRPDPLHALPHAPECVDLTAPLPFQPTEFDAQLAEVEFLRRRRLLHLPTEGDDGIARHVRPHQATLLGYGHLLRRQQ